MRMASALSTLLAVLCGAVAGAGDLMANVSRVHRSPAFHHPHRVMTEEELDAAAAWKRSHWREMQTIMRHEGNQHNGVVECCPSVLEMVVKKGGRTASGLYVELYETDDNKQQFYELSCAPGVADKPCRFVDPRLYNDSRCVQKYSYSYALVRCSDSAMPDRVRNDGNFPVPGSGGCSMDYVQVRAGCECQINTTKHKNSHRRHKQKKRNKPTEKYGET